MLPDSREALDFVNAFRATGCRIALDDFGAGLSLIAFARSARPDIIKIDAVFVRDAAEFNVDRETLASLIALSACLAAQVVIEGIEDEAGLATAHAAGAKWLQGYYLGRPSIPDELGARNIQRRLASALAAPTARGVTDDIAGGLGRS
jgi:EAL domain-containing protein (putative c-di-GMP-specific phosphodiesterase class I)